MSSTLTKGALNNIINNIKVNRPVLQYLGHKKIEHFSPRTRYRVLISDGEVCHPFAIFASNLNYLLENEELYKYATFVMVDYIIDSTKFNILAIIDILLKENPAKLITNLNTLTLNNICYIKNINSEGNIAENLVVRVISKSPIYYYNKGRGSYCLFELMDSTYCIDGLAFDNDCLNCYVNIEFGKVYLISNIRARGNTHNHFSPERHEYQLIFEKQTIIQPWYDEAVPKLQYNCMTFDNFRKINGEMITDAIGIIKGNIVCPSPKGPYRQITLADASESQLIVKLWNQWCDQVQGKEGDILFIKDGKLQLTDDISLDAGKKSTVVINPNIPELKSLATVAYALPLDCVKLTQIKNNDFPWMTIAEVQAYMENNSRLNFTVVATIVTSRKYDCFYKACNTCMKRLVEQETDYWCTKCRTKCSIFYWNCVLRMEIADATGMLDVVCFENAIEQLLGVAPKMLAQLKRNNHNKKLKKYFDLLDFEHLEFKISTQTNTFKEEDFLRSVIVSAASPDIKVYGKQLLSEISEFSSK